VSPSPAIIESLYGSDTKKFESTEPINDLQMDIIKIAASVTGEQVPSTLNVEHDGVTIPIVLILLILLNRFFLGCFR